MLTMAPARLTLMQIVNSLLLILISFGIILALPSVVPPSRWDPAQSRPSSNSKTSDIPGTRPTPPAPDLHPWTQKIRPPSLLLCHYRVHLIQRLRCPDRGAGRQTGTVTARSQWLRALTVPAVLKGNQSGQR